MFLVTNFLTIGIIIAAAGSKPVLSMELSSPKSTYSIDDNADISPTDCMWVRACDISQPLSLTAQLLAKICREKIAPKDDQLVPITLENQLAVLKQCLLHYKKDKSIAHKHYGWLLYDTKHIESLLACFSSFERATVVAQLFYFAIVHGVMATAQLLSLQGAVITLDCLNSAVSTGNLPMVKWLYKKGGKRLLANISEVCETPLHKAAREDRLNILDFFLHKKVDVALKDSFGETALDEAIFWRKTRCIYRLLDYGAQLDQELEFNNAEIRDLVNYYKILSQEDKKTVCKLSRLLAFSKVKKLKKFCRKYDILETELFFGTLILHKAVEWGSIEIIDFILTKITNVNIRHCYTGETVLHVAAQLCSSRIIKILIAAGADATIKDSSHRLPFDLVASDNTVAQDLLRTEECSCFFCGRDIGKRTFLTCGHAQFHRSCLKKNFKINGFICPICQADVGILIN